MMKKSLSEDQRKKLRGERKININQRMQIVREIQEGNITVEQAAKEHNRHRSNGNCLDLRSVTYYAGYYERTLTSLATLCVEKGVVTLAELEQLAQGSISAGHAQRNRVAATRPQRERFVPGDQVAVRTDLVAGHVRMPAYIRGKHGVGGE
jgi:hypothetical protein